MLFPFLSRPHNFASPPFFPGGGGGREKREIIKVASLGPKEERKRRGCFMQSSLPDCLGRFRRWRRRRRYSSSSLGSSFPPAFEDEEGEKRENGFSFQKSVFCPTPSSHPRRIEMKDPFPLSPSSRSSIIGKEKREKRFFCVKFGNESKLGGAKKRVMKKGNFFFCLRRRGKRKKVGELLENFPSRFLLFSFPSLFFPGVFARESRKEEFRCGIQRLPLGLFHGQMAKGSNRTQIVIDSFLEKLFIEMVKANLLLLPSFPLLFYSSLCSAPPEKRIDPLGALSSPSSFEEGKERRKRRKKIVWKRGKERNGRSSTAISPPSLLHLQNRFRPLGPRRRRRGRRCHHSHIENWGRERGPKLDIFGGMTACKFVVYNIFFSAEMLGPARFEKS